MEELLNIMQPPKKDGRLAAFVIYLTNVTRKNITSIKKKNIDKHIDENSTEKSKKFLGCLHRICSLDDATVSTTFVSIFFLSIVQPAAMSDEPDAVADAKPETPSRIMLKEEIDNEAAAPVAKIGLKVHQLMLMYANPNGQNHNIYLLAANLIVLGGFPDTEVRLPTFQNNHYENFSVQSRRSIQRCETVQ